MTPQEAQKLHQDLKDMKEALREWTDTHTQSERQAKALITREHIKPLRLEIYEIQTRLKQDDVPPAPMHPSVAISGIREDLLETKTEYDKYHQDFLEMASSNPIGAIEYYGNGLAILSFTVRTFAPVLDKLDGATPSPQLVYEVLAMITVIYHGLEVQQRHFNGIQGLPDLRSGIAQAEVQARVDLLNEYAGWLKTGFDMKCKSVQSWEVLQESE